MREWLKNPTLLEADKDAKYKAVIEIDLNEITEPILACPNDPDDVKTLSEIHEQGLKTDIDEVFVGSCMTNIGLFRALGEVLKGEGQVSTKLWVCPPTKMDERTLVEEGYYSIFGQAGARTELPGCSLCMGNQAQVAEGAWVFSTSTRNFDNRLGKNSKVYLGSAELAAVVALKGKIPTKEEYLDIVNGKIKPEMTDEIYRYLNFNKVNKEELEAMVR
jgi:aconitate hydratase 2/2-methylisocitrate dehydratase